MTTVLFDDQIEIIHDCFPMDVVNEAERIGIRRTHAASYKNDSRGVQLNYQVAGEMLACMRCADIDVCEMEIRIPEFLKPVTEHLEEDE